MQRLFNDSGYILDTQEGINKYTSPSLKLFHCLSFNFFEDIKYKQYICVCRRTTSILPNLQVP